MTELDDILVPVAQQLLEQFGKQLTWCVPGKTAYDPLEQEVIENTSSRQELTIKSLPPSDYKKFFTEGTIESIDVMTGFAGGTVLNPDLSWRVNIDGTEFRVNVINPLYSGELVALWMIGLSRV